jgi:hypothetical protein
MQAALVQWSPRIMGEKLWKSWVFLNGINGSKTVAGRWNMMEQMVVQNLTEPMKMLKELRNLMQSYRSLSITAMTVQLNLDKGTITSTEKGRNFFQRSDSPSWQCSSSQGALCWAVTDPKIDCWNGTPILFPWFGSEWLQAIPSNKVCSKGTKTSGYWRHLKGKMWRRHWKLFHDRCSKNVSSSGSIVGLSAQMLMGSTVKVTPLSKL